MKDIRAGSRPVPSSGIETCGSPATAAMQVCRIVLMRDALRFIYERP